MESSKKPIYMSCSLLTAIFLETPLKMTTDQTLQRNLDAASDTSDFSIASGLLTPATTSSTTTQEHEPAAEDMLLVDNGSRMAPSKRDSTNSSETDKTSFPSTFAPPLKQNRLTQQNEDAAELTDSPEDDEREPMTPSRHRAGHHFQHQGLA